MQLKHYIFIFLYSIFELWLGKTEKFVANSTWELIFYYGKRLIERVKGKK